MPRILIVDDDAVIRELLAYVLKQEGYEVIEATLTFRRASLTSHVESIKPDA